MDDLWTFNGIDASSGAYLLQASPGDLARVASKQEFDPKALSELKQRRQQASNAHFGVKAGLDVHDLAATGWAAVFPATKPDSPEATRQAALCEALAPLLAHRRALAGRHNERYYREYSGGAGVRANEGKQQFLARHGAGPGPADPDKVPYYLLLIAHPQEISFRFQSQLSVQYAVGRICFDTIEEYAHYARSVVLAETRATPRPRRLACFATANPDDNATQASATSLVLPLSQTLARDPALSTWAIDVTSGEAATRDALAALLARGNAPALLFTASHGMSFPKDHPSQLRHQGALLCQDWPGPKQWGQQPIPEAHYFAGDHLQSDTDLLGTVAFMFACYGAGTPEHDEFAAQAFKERAQIAPHPFVAGLPKAMLGLAKGALAVIGHIERAWGHSFLWARSGAQGKPGPQLAVFESTLRSIMEGMPVGAAMEYFDERYAELASDLSVELEKADYGEQPDPYTLASMWTANNDARGYAILGDPAVRVMGPGAPPTSRATTAQTAVTPVAATTLAPVDNTAAASFGIVERIRGEEEPAPQAAQDTDVVDSIKGFVTKLGTTISAALDDMSNLEVTTYSTADMTSIFVDQGRMIGAELRAYTRISLDGDTIVCVPERDGEVDKALFEIHQAMVKQAQDARTELMKTIVHAAASLFGHTK